MDKKSIMWIAIVIIAIGLGSLFLLRKQPAPISRENPQANTAAPMQVQQPSPPSTATRTIVVPLSAQNNSGESGTATLTEIDGKTNVTLVLNGAPSGVTQPAHIHTGTCATIGGVVYPLTFPLNGRSDTTLGVTIDNLLSQLPLAINVHKSTSEANIYVSCGDISNTSSISSPSQGQPSPTTSQTVNDDRSGGGTFSTPTDRRRGADKPED